MHVVVITKHGGPDVLRVEDRADPSTGAGEVRIGVAAAGVNFADMMARMGLYPDAPKPPAVRPAPILLRSKPAPFVRATSTKSTATKPGSRTQHAPI